MEEVTDLLREAGASDALVTVVQHETDRRNSARLEVEKWVNLWDVTDPAEMPPVSGGHFFDALWDGNVSKAWKNADGNNKAILRECGLAPVTA